MMHCGQPMKDEGWYGVGHKLRFWTCRVCAWHHLQQVKDGKS